MNDPVPLPPPPSAWGTGAPTHPTAQPVAQPVAQPGYAPGYPSGYPGGYYPNPAPYPNPYQNPHQDPYPYPYAPGVGHRPLPGATLPGYPPRPPRPPRQWPFVAVLASLVVLLVLCGGTITTLTLRPEARDTATGVVFVDPRPEARDIAVRAALERRAKAVREKNKKAFLADVDQRDSALVARQTVEYDNLTKLPFAEFAYEMEKSISYDSLAPAEIRERFKTLYRVPGVTLRYRFDELDDKAIAVPWVPIFGLADGAWKVVGEASDRSLPHGANGQPWNSPVPITVVRSARVLLVLETSDAARADAMLKTAEASVDRVVAVRPSGWVGKVMVTALVNDTVFNSYFRKEPGQAADVAAFASPQFDQVPGWHEPINLTAGRVVLSPTLLSEPGFQAHAITHEFAHVAMFPVTKNSVPMWMIEGFAEYVAYKTETVSATALSQALSGIDRGSGLPSNALFQSAKAPDGYLLGWLACRMISERWGEAKLIALYEQFAKSGQDEAIRQILGISADALNQQATAYIDSKR